MSLVLFGYLVKDVWCLLFGYGVGRGFSYLRFMVCFCFRSSEMFSIVCICFILFCLACCWSWLTFLLILLFFMVGAVFIWFGFYSLRGLFWLVFRFDGRVFYSGFV